MPMNQYNQSRGLAQLWLGDAIRALEAGDTVQALDKIKKSTSQVKKMAREKKKLQKQKEQP